MDDNHDNQGHKSDKSRDRDTQSAFRVTHNGYDLRKDSDGKTHYKQLARQVPHKSGDGHRVYLDAIPFKGFLDFFPAEKRLETLRSESEEDDGKGRSASQRSGKTKRSRHNDQERGR